MPRTARAVNLSTELTADEKEQQMKAKLAKIRQYAKAESKARSDKDKLLRQLEKEMTAAGKRKLEVFYDNETIIGEIGTGDPRNVVDTALLASKITHAQFVSIATVAGGAVKEAFGTGILNQVLVEKEGERKLRVEVA
ncbi:hypothetical protein CC53_gp060 [Rhizobium phage vB_RleS_L338C]|uniref:hypothetical protein n=1 Tax=Rhizobium phage vB_RleS_L338C TaxID=1414737 RepID=UPI0003D9529D|nr:hypothetical protein CC53_gp060 [Rhizobium phage vB_RleS_L338C]AHC30477.1 hypothetical protein L338C_060 [Rhizobium phage vB_RleS_L338C]